MAEHRSRKNKESPHYGFLVSWQPKPASQARVNREPDSNKTAGTATIGQGKRAESLAQAEPGTGTKKNIIRSLILISFILILELVVYLAMPR